MCTVVFQTIINLACTYCGCNDTAREELIEVGYETLLDFAAKNLVTDERELEEGKRLLTAKLMQSEEFCLEIYGILKNRLRDYAKSMSERSPVFRLLYPEKCKKKIATVFYGSFAEKDDDKESKSEMSREYCPVKIEDTSCETAIEETELWIDVSNILTPEDTALFRKRVDGAKLEELAEEYGISFQAVAKRLKNIAKKLTPLGESIKACA